MMKFWLLFLILIFPGTDDGAGDFYPEKTAEKFLQKTLKNKELKVDDRFDLTQELGTGKRMVAYVFQNDAGDTHYAVFTESKGRYDLFDYLVVTDKSGVIKQVKVLRYRSEHGGEIASKKWLEQFVGFSGGNLYYEEDIAAISGATISAMSITRDIPKVMAALQNHMIE